MNVFDFIINNWEYLVVFLFIAFIASYKLVQRVNEANEFEEDVNTGKYYLVKILVAVAPFAVLIVVVFALSLI